MAKAIATGSAVTARLASLYLKSSNSTPIHFALCTEGGYATALAIVAALGCSGMSRLAAR